MWETILITGGPLQIRSLIHNLTRSLSPSHVSLSDVENTRMFFKNMHREYENASSDDVITNEFIRMYEAIYSFQDGLISDRELLRKSSISISRAKTSRGPQSSAVFTMDDTDTEVDTLPARLQKDPKKWRTTYKTVSYAIYITIILFIVAFSATTIHKKNDLLDSSLEHIKRYRNTGELNMDLPNSYFPPTNYLDTKPAITTFVTPLHPSILVEHHGRGTDEQERRDNNMEAFFEKSKEIASGPGYEIYTKERYNGEMMHILEKWVELMVNVVNPIYTTSSSMLRILIDNNINIPSGSSIEDEEEFTQMNGVYNPDIDSVFVRLPRRDYGQGYVVRVLVHELAHRAHLEMQHIALECKRAYAGKMIDDPSAPGICTTHSRTIESTMTRNHLMTIRDTVESILYLGIHNDEISYEEAVVYNKMILDARIYNAYERAIQDTKYKEYIRKYRISYSLINYMEFWAEASVSFLYKQGPERFPNRSWIQENDPELYDMLAEVYQNTQQYE